MTVRRMTNSFKDKVFYESVFDSITGTIIRETVIPDFIEVNDWSGKKQKVLPHLCHYLTKTVKDNIEERPSFSGMGGMNYIYEWYGTPLHKEWGNEFGRRSSAFSPSPETLDVQITNWCAFGCSFCYQSSTPQEAHGNLDVILGSILSFDHAPYQIAYGGGEPTSHPEFVTILEETRKYGSVPNYTTAGQMWAETKNKNIRQKIIDATVKYCGGVALTFHRWKGEEYFLRAYKAMKESLEGLQLNIHLVADKSGADNLKCLVELSDSHKLGPLNIVLLAYHPVGRGSFEHVMPRRIWNGDFIKAIELADEKGHHIAFSEGLLPYFVSRPELPIVTVGAESSEGRYSAYIDMHGRMSKSSFEAPEGDNPRTPSLEKCNLQEGWSKGEIGSTVDNRSYSYEACFNCPDKFRCGPVDVGSYFMCERSGNPMEDRTEI